MLRIITLVLLAGMIVSCKSGINSRLLSGTWKTKKDAGLSTYSTITFLNGDSVIAKTFDYNRLSSEISGTYTLDNLSSILKTSYGDSISYELKITKLTKTELELYYQSTKQYQNYLRQ